jgi:muramoyltetrapeptide carboxypeptidase
MSTLLKPEFLAPGDTIGVYSPSSGIETELRDNYERGKRLLLERGYRVREAEHTFSWQAHYSAEGQTKVEDFLSLLLDHNVKAILPTLGGTTAHQMLPHLPWSEIPNHPKMIFGFSDNSLQCNVITDRIGLVTFHGHSDVVFGLGDLGDEEKMRTFATKGSYTREMFFDTLEGRLRPGEVRKATNWRVLRTGQAEGRLLGGNLDVLDIVRGTPYEFEWKEKILFWEAAYIELHRVDLLLAGLAMTGALANIRGMIVGKGTNLSEQFFAQKHESLDEIILRHCDPFDFPILVDADIGHDMECCMLPVGAQARIEGESVVLLESPYHE